jgi:uncharacterized coiled-coil DUF342 family protein
MSFDEKNARRIINLLLENDIASYKNWLKEIKLFDSAQLENLLNGNNEYSYHVSNEKSFQKVIMKFNNFQYFIQQWYKDEKYYSYLIELWKSNISIESLKQKLEDDLFQKEETLIKYLQSKSISYSKWPNNLKNEFITIVNNTVDTIYSELKEQLNKNPEIEELIYEVNEIKNKFNEMDNSCEKEAKKNVENTSNNLIFTIITGLISLGGSILIEKGTSNIVKKEKEYLEKKLIEKNFKNVKKVCDYICKKIKKIKDGIFNYKGKTKPIKSILTKVKNGKLNNLDFKNTVSAFFNNNLVCGIHAAMSFLNVAWTAYEWYNVYSEINKIKNEDYRNKLNSILKSYNSHLKEIKLEDDNIENFIIKAKYILENIQKDQKELENLIVKINEDIQILKSHRNKAIVGTVLSGVLTGIGGVGVALSFNGIGLTYCISTVSNGISMITHINNLIKCIKNINELKELLNEATEESKKIQKEIDSLFVKIKQRQLELPKYCEEKDYNDKKIRNSYF